MRPSIFHLVSEHQPSGDQPKAIDALTTSVQKGHKHQTLLGVTGSGKTFTIANTIKNLNLPTLIIAPNKTLAAQLFGEFKKLFPKNKVGFFISYYDYYQPEAYLPGSDTYIAKDSSINDDIDKMRHSATQDLFERKDVIIIASVSCIYGLGSPETYASQVVTLAKGQELPRNLLLRQLVDIQYTRNDVSLERGSFRVRGDTVDILPANQKEQAIRIEFFGDEIDQISLIDSLTGQCIKEVQGLSIYPNSHYITERKNMKAIIRDILKDLGVRLKELRNQNKIVEYQRLEQRTMHDVELMEQLGYCPGIENYARYLTGQPSGSPPPTLLDYFPENFLTIIDESHITVPQLGAMFKGDRARKTTLVDFGFRLPAATDNRPLNFDEFIEKTSSIIHVSATPGEFDLSSSGTQVFEQIIRPTGLIDPPIEVRQAKNQVDDLLSEINKLRESGDRVLITTLTKRMAEDLTKYYDELGVSVRYLHSDIDSLERHELLRDLRKGVFQVLIGINLLREGLDLPEVALVSVMDADKTGFLRSRSSLIQTVGRAARNASGKVLFYADSISIAMQECIDETNRRRKIQQSYNNDNNITPTSIKTEISPGLREMYGLETDDEGQRNSAKAESLIKDSNIKDARQLDKLIREKTKSMKKAAKDLDFETAADLRDLIASLKEKLLTLNDQL